MRYDLPHSTQHNFYFTYDTVYRIYILCTCQSEWRHPSAQATAGPHPETARRGRGGAHVCAAVPFHEGLTYRITWKCLGLGGHSGTTNWLSEACHVTNDLDHKGSFGGSSQQPGYEYYIVLGQVAAAVAAVVVEAAGRSSRQGIFTNSQITKPHNRS